MRPYLALFRCGPDSPQLALLETLASAEFDFALSWSGPVAPSLPGAAFVHASEGSKWPALAQSLAAFAAQVAGYSHVWLPDDDLVFDPATVARLFAICDQLNLELGQPAFSADSPVAHPLARRHREFQVRFTNHVDTAAPLLSRTMLAKVLPTLADGGLVPDMLWPHLSRPGRVAIIDAATVSRSRGPAASATPHEALLNLGGLLESGDAWCLSPQAADVEVLLQALMKSCSGLDARSLTRYLAQHLALADGGAAASIRDELERQLSAVGLRFNCAAPPPPAEAAAPVEADRTLAGTQRSRLARPQARYQRVTDGRAQQGCDLAYPLLDVAGFRQLPC